MVSREIVHSVWQNSTINFVRHLVSEYVRREVHPNTSRLFQHLQVGHQKCISSLNYSKRLLRSLFYSRVHCGLWEMIFLVDWFTLKMNN